MEKGDRVVFKEGENPCPKDAGVITADFGDAGECLTACPHGDSAKVGSMACSEYCYSFRGFQTYGIHKGTDGLFGTPVHHRDVYCAKQKKEGGSTGRQRKVEKS